MTQSDNLATANSQPTISIRCGQTSDEKSSGAAKNDVSSQELTHDSTNDNGTASNTRLDLTTEFHESCNADENDTNAIKRQGLSSSPSRKENGEEEAIKDESGIVDSSNEGHGDVSAPVATAVERGLPVYLIERNAAKEFLESTKFDS